MGVVWTFFVSSIISLFFFLSLGDGPIQTEILTQRAVKPKTTNQPKSISQSKDAVVRMANSVDPDLTAP